MPKKGELALPYFQIFLLDGFQIRQPIMLPGVEIFFIKIQINGRTLLVTDHKKGAHYFL